MTFEFKSQYAEYNKKLSQLPDEASQLPGLLKDLKRAFRDRRTREYSFRVQQLQSLKKGLEEMQDELCAAVEKDLGKRAFMTYVAEVHLLKSDI